MIQYVEKGEGLTQYLVNQGIVLSEVYTSGEVRWESNKPDEVVNAAIESYNPWPFEKAKKMNEINDWFTDAVAQLTAGTTQTERDSWSVQVNEAYGIRPVAMLAAMASARGIDVQDLIVKVKYKAELFATYYGAIQGKRDALEDLVKSFPDVGEFARLPELWKVSCTD